MTQWYFADAAGTQQGPIDAETLLALYAAAEVLPDTLVWHAGMANWQPLSSVAVELGLGEDIPAAQAASPTGGLPAARAAAAAPTTAHVQYAGFWRRAAANVIDSFIVALLILPIALPMSIGANLAMAHGDGGAGAIAGGLALQAVLQLFGFVVTVLYFSCFHASRLMASPGKLAVGIKVVRSDGQPLRFGRSLGRGAAYYLSFLTLYIGFLIAAFTQRKQALHDLICDTLVVDRWAFTDTPERQKPGLDTVSIVILAIYGGLLVLALTLIAIGMVIALATGFH